MATIRLRHGTYTVGKRVEYFYDGIAVAVDGTLELDASNEPWIRRAWVSGYNLSPDGERLWTLMDVQREIERQTAVSGEKDDSDQEGADSGRQSTTPNRVRKSQPKSR